MDTIVAHNYLDAYLDENPDQSPSQSFKLSEPIEKSVEGEVFTFSIGSRRTVGEMHEEDTATTSFLTAKFYCPKVARVIQNPHKKFIVAGRLVECNSSILFVGFTGVSESSSPWWGWTKNAT